ncbi:hypothetical protein niasHT_031366 [Heterodera trifolii]|uniref:Uncharacterized protein n=1 Tax=Heterodera trifolii TaxID=157864 RepID=A0ABD2IXU0_9BILA
MSDNPKDAEAKMAKAIFISADCWLCVFDLLPPRQLGFGIALISHRFDFYIDEHFKTRKWALAFIRIHSKIGKNGTKEMGIVNYDEETLPIAQIQMPRKVSGFERISIAFIDQNAIVLLNRFRQLFAACQINLAIDTASDRILDFILRNVWPILGQNICGIFLFANVFHLLRKCVPSILDDCPSLRVVSSCFDEFFPEFPADDSAAASDGQALAKWLFTPLQSNLPKVLKCSLDYENGNWPSKIDAFKAAFASASSPVNCIVIIWFLRFAHSVVPFALTNELTREQLALKRTDFNRFLLVRCPIARDERKWAKWEEEAIDWHIRWNRIDIHIDKEDKIGDDLLNATPGPSDQ